MGNPIIETRYSKENDSYIHDTKKQRNLSYIKTLKKQQMQQEFKDPIMR